LRTFCSTISTVVPASAMRRAIASSSSTIFGARPSEGSSSISRRGALISARATATICCSPPLIVPASCVARSASLGKSCSTWRSRSARSALSTSQPPSSRFSATVIWANSCRPSGTSAMPRLTMASVLASGSITRSSSRTSPWRGMRPPSAFSSVVLPAPLGPRMTVRPGRASSVMSRSTRKLP
jgi:hypothetical protein